MPCLLLCLRYRSTEGGESGLGLHSVAPASSSGHGYLQGFDGLLSLLPHREWFYGTKNYTELLENRAIWLGSCCWPQPSRKCWLSILSSNSASQPRSADSEWGEVSGGLTSKLSIPLKFSTGVTRGWWLGLLVCNFCRCGQSYTRAHIKGLWTIFGDQIQMQVGELNHHLWVFFIRLKDCVYMHVHVCAGSHEDQKSTSDTLEIVTDIGH